MEIFPSPYFANSSSAIRPKLKATQSFLLMKHDDVMNNIVEVFPHTQHGNFSESEISGLEAVPLFDCTRCIFQTY